MRPGVLSACLCILWAGLALAQQAYDFGVDIKKLTRRQDDSSRIVVGRLPVASNSTIPRRMEIREMREDTYKWDLFVLALSMFQYVSQDDPLSWYQIAGMCHRRDACNRRPDFADRDSRCALSDLEWRRARAWRRHVGILHAQFGLISDMAQALPGLV